jgi:hypothetical protein
MAVGAVINSHMVGRRFAIIRIDGIYVIRTSVTAEQAVLMPQSVEFLAFRGGQAAVAPAGIALRLSNPVLIDCAVGSNSVASSSDLRPACTSSTIWRQNSGA